MICPAGFSHSTWLCLSRWYLFPVIRGTQAEYKKKNLLKTAQIGQFKCTVQFSQFTGSILFKGKNCKINEIFLFCFLKLSMISWGAFKKLCQLASVLDFKWLGCSIFGAVNGNRFCSSIKKITNGCFHTYSVRMWLGVVFCTKLLEI